MLPSPIPRGSTRRFHLRKVRGRVGLGLVAGLSVLAGMTDAIGFLATGDFVSFMSGNTTRMAVSLSEGHLAAFGRLALAVLCFVLGNAFGVVVARFSGRRAAPLLAVIATLLAIAALWPFAWRVPAVVLSILAMGMLNAVVEQVNGLPIGLTYVTGALSRFGRGLGRWLLGERREGWRVQLVPWAGMLAGAVLGALLEFRMGLLALTFSAGLAALLAIASLWVPRPWQRGYMPR
ncbi:YoaK family protein [Metapseudomonas otitidis]|uniref:YoaK family protein n=1 Tax=Metapseudomonas otitidis TaxID=319939 RepID=UPI003EE1BA03